MSHAPASRRTYLAWVAMLAALPAGCSGGDADAPAQTGGRSGAATTSADAPAGGCPVTVPNGKSPPRQRRSLGGHRESPGWHRDGRLWVALWDDGIIRWRAEPDGSIGMKFPWWRGVRGRLRIKGRRLDAVAPPLRAHVPRGYGATGFQSTAVVFPTPGCWKVTGAVAGARLEFVTLVLEEPE